MLTKDKFKEQIVYHLRNFSSEDKPLGSEYFFDRLEGYNGNKPDEKKTKLRDFQRQLAERVQEIIKDQMTYKEFVICSCNEGYYIPKTEEGYLKGRRYLYSKIDEVHQRIKFIDEMRVKKVYQAAGNQTEDIFSQEVF
jgi:hypothetical protein